MAHEWGRGNTPAAVDGCNLVPQSILRNEANWKFRKKQGGEVHEIQKLLKGGKLDLTTLTDGTTQTKARIESCQIPSRWEKSSSLEEKKMKGDGVVQPESRSDRLKHLPLASYSEEKTDKKADRTNNAAASMATPTDEELKTVAAGLR
ncbi:unnamed protein product [Linum trigynum]|uniref:Uncharacterized protein n=1 Tax=Linum trigynum TaxID=586398 RepID=A0AAV2DZI0_9ROSI